MTSGNYSTPSVVVVLVVLVVAVAAFSLLTN